MKPHIRYFERRREDGTTFRAFTHETGFEGDSLILCDDGTARVMLDNDKGGWTQRRGLTHAKAWEAFCAAFLPWPGIRGAELEARL